MPYNKSKVNIHHTVLFLAQQSGLSVKFICEYVGIDQNFLIAKSETMNTDQIINFWDMANKELGYERPGLKFAESATLTYIGVMGDLISKLTNLFQMIQVTCQVRNTITEMIHFNYDETETEVTLHIHAQKIWEEIDLESSLSASEYTMGTFYQIMNQLVPNKITPIEIGIIPSKKSKLEYYQSYFNTNIIFGETFYIKFKKVELLQEISTKNKLLHAHYLDLCNDQQIEETEGKSLRTQLENIIFYTCWPKIPTVEEMASYLFTPYKTLQRNLRKENISYRDIVNDVKSKYALNMLKSGKFSAKEIGEILNYSDLSSFSRAFKEFHGTTFLETKQNQT